MEAAIKIIFDEEIYISNEVSGTNGEVCEISISTNDYDNSSFFLYLTKEQVEQTIQALKNALTKDCLNGGA